MLGGQPDRVPKGEFLLSRALLREVLRLAGGPTGEGGREEAGGGEEEERALRFLGADMVGALASDPSWLARLEYWAGGDFFVWAVVDGPFQGLAAARGWERALLTLAGPGAGREELKEQADRAARELLLAVEAGADGIVLGEDVAYSGGLLLRPRLVEEVLWPLWRDLVEAARSLTTGRGERSLVLFHSDGAVEPLFPLLLEAGFDGAHSLEPEAGMDPVRLLERYRGKLGLWGGLSLALLAGGSREEVGEEVQRLVSAGRRGGFVLGTSAGVVTEWVSAERLLYAYRCSEGV